MFRFVTSDENWAKEPYAESVHADNTKMEHEACADLTHRKHHTMAADQKSNLSSAVGSHTVKRAVVRMCIDALLNARKYNTLR